MDNATDDLRTVDIVIIGIIDRRKYFCSSEII